MFNGPDFRYIYICFRSYVVTCSIYIRVSKYPPNVIFRNASDKTAYVERTRVRSPNAVAFSSNICI